MLATPSMKELVSEAWNIGGPSVYDDQLNSLATNDNYLTDGKFRVYMTNIQHSYNCDIFYPMKTWHSVRHHFKELKVCTEVPEVGSVIKDSGGVTYCIQAFEIT